MLGDAPSYELLERTSLATFFDDPVATIFATIDVLANPTPDSKDGLGYELIVSTPATDATIQFSNPRTELGVPWK